MQSAGGNALPRGQAKGNGSIRLGALMSPGREAAGTRIWNHHYAPDCCPLGAAAREKPTCRGPPQSRDTEGGRSSLRVRADLGGSRTEVSGFSNDSHRALPRNERQVAISNPAVHQVG